MSFPVFPMNMFMYAGSALYMMCKIILVMTLNRVEWPPLNTLCIRYAELSFSLRSQYLLLLGSCGMSLDEHGHTGKGPRRSQSINKVSLSEDTR